MRHLLSGKQTFLLFFISFIIRASVMLFIIQPHGFYKQADSNDYHNCAMSLARGKGMYRLDNQEPIFWRTPGYPSFLAVFYYVVGVSSWKFDANSTAQKLAVWLQILLSSSIPLVLFYLGMALTANYSIAIVLSWIAVIHPGLVLASTYLLTEGIALILFYLFLLFFYKNFGIWNKKNNEYITIIIAAMCLGLYTWMRPMGEFVAYFSTMLLFIASKQKWNIRLKKGFLFLIVFIASIFPWYIRNNQLTGNWFFCPTIGTYLNCFSVPKILRRTLGKPLIECHQIAQNAAGIAVYNKRLALEQSGLHVSPAVSNSVSFPIVLQHPWYFIYDWLNETIKTTFDLYSYQYISMLDDSFWYDPIEEFLPEKIADCLYKHTMPWYMRIAIWIEFFGALLMWIGIIGGFWLYIIKPDKNKYSHIMTRIWLLCIPVIGIIIGMTGGFGYARLRLPAEPLIIILSLTYWFRNTLTFPKE